MGKGWKNPHKAATAAKKGQLFTKLAREIAVAAKLGGPDPTGNSRLKLAIDAARSASCPKDTIDRAIKKGSGQLDDGAIIEELSYEGMGPHKVGVIVECQSDNKNRTVSDLRTIFKKAGGEFGTSVGWMFDRVCLVEGTKEAIDDPEEEAIEAGANEVEAADKEGYWSFYGSPEDLDSIRQVLNERGWTITVAELSYKANQPAEMGDEERQKVIQFLEQLEDNDDTHRVHASIG